MSEFRCIRCNKAFKLKHHLQRHIRNVKCMPDASTTTDVINQLSTINNIIKTHADLITTMQQTIQKQQKEIQKQQKEIELLKSQTKEINNLNAPNNQGVAANKIIVNNISTSNTNYVLKLLPKFFNMIYEGLPTNTVQDELLACIWNHPEHPENHIFYLPNIKKDHVVIQNGESFKLVNFKEIEPDIQDVLTKVSHDFHYKKQKTADKWKKELPLAYKKFVKIFSISDIYQNKKAIELLNA